MPVESLDKDYVRTDQQMVTCNTNSPPVGATAIWLLCKNFRRNAASSSDQRAAAKSHARRWIFAPVTTTYSLAQPKVNQTNPRLSIKHHIVQFEIAMDESGAMHSIHGNSQGSEVVPRQDWWQRCLLIS